MTGEESQTQGELQARNMAIAISGLGLLNEYERQKASGKLMLWTTEQTAEYGRLKDWWSGLGVENQQRVVALMHQLAAGIKYVSLAKVFGS